MPVDNFEPSCFFTGFNGPVDPSHVLASQTANSSNPLTLNQAKFSGTMLELVISETEV